MEARFHGVRGSAPAAGAQYAGYGGDTPCIELTHGARRVILDAGSGLRHVRPAADGRDDIDLFLSHYHFDHLIGLPFFAPLWRKGGHLRIWAPRLEDLSPQLALERFYAPPYCPFELGKTPMTIEIRPFTPGARWKLDRNLTVSTMPQIHPGGSTAIRIENRDTSFVYATDVELAGDGQTDALARFASRASLLVVDAMSTDEEAARRSGWGHSSWRQAVAAGISARAARIALFHHDPAHEDEKLRAEESLAQSVAHNAFFARQGDVIRL